MAITFQTDAFRTVTHATGTHHVLPVQTAEGPSPPTLRTLQLGKGWFTRHSGGGLDRVFNALVGTFHQVDIIADGLVVGEEADQHQSRIQGIGRNSHSVARRLWAFRGAVRQALADRSYHLVASHFALYAAGVLDLLQPYPHVIHFHGPWADESRAEGASTWNIRAKEALERRVYAQGDRFIVLSEAFADILAGEYGVPRARIRVVPGGVDVPRFETGETPAEARERLDWPADRPVILTVRRLARRMGLENLIRAMEAVRRRVPDALLVIAGSGPLRPALQAQIELEGLEDHVRLIGFVEEDLLPLAYRAATLSVVPSLRLEGFGLVTIESLAAGTPVLVSPVGGLPEVVADLSDALVLPDTSVASLADALTDVLLGTRPVPEEETCRRYVRNNYDWPVIARKVRNVYEEVL